MPIELEDAEREALERYARDRIVGEDLTRFVRERLMTEDQRKRLAARGWSLETLLEGAWESGPERYEGDLAWVAAVFLDWNRKIGARLFEV